jgi:hypothetical protein
MRARLDRRAIVVLVAVFAIAMAAAIAITRRPADAPLSVPPEPDAVALDYADIGLRQALDEYGMFALGRGNEPIAPTCSRGSNETYRFVSMPGLEGDFVAIEAVVAGSSGRAERREFTPVRGGDEFAWQLRQRRVLEPREVDALRNGASRWLLSGKDPSPGARPVDASTWYVELCRLGRYHFAARYGAENHRDENAEFLALARSMQALLPVKKIP